MERKADKTVWNINQIAEKYYQVIYKMNQIL